MYRFLQIVMISLFAVNFAMAEEVMKLIAQYDYQEPVLSVKFKRSFTPSPMWLVQHPSHVDVFAPAGRMETSIPSNVADVIISSPDQRYFAIVNVSADGTASVASSVLVVRVFHFTGEGIYTHVQPLNRVLNRPQLMLNDRGSIILADNFGTTIREVNSGTTLQQIDLQSVMADWSAQQGSAMVQLSHDRGYLVATTIPDSLTKIPGIRIAALSNRLNLLKHYQIFGTLVELFEVTGHGHAFLGFQAETEGRTALIGRDSVLASFSGLPQKVKRTFDDNRALLVFPDNLKIINLNDGMLESGFTSQNMDKTIDAEFLPGIEAYALIFGRQHLMQNELRYDNLNLVLNDKTGKIIFSEIYPGDMTLKPAFHRVSLDQIALKLDKQVLLYAIPNALEKQ